MKYLTAATVFVFLTGCATQTIKQPIPQNSVKEQQIRAEAAQAEMESDIKSGMPTLREPVLRPVNEPLKTKVDVTKASVVSSLKPRTKYPLKNGYPEWFYSSVYDGYIGAVGIAQKQSGFSAQKKAAKMQAQKNLVKQIDVLVKSELKIETTAVESAAVQYYKEKISSMTKESSEMFLSNFKIMDEWLDEKTGEFYVWMVLEK